MPRHLASNGAAQTISAKSFNERVKSLVSDKPDPQPAKKPAPHRSYAARATNRT